MKEEDLSSTCLNAPNDVIQYASVDPEIKKTPRGNTWRILKSVYGLPQSARNWQVLLHATLAAHGFQRLDSEVCFCIHKTLVE